ncbi:MAG: PLDc N-terminal domain-containing protein, partial [Lachnospiraceae bacterium]
MPRFFSGNISDIYRWIIEHLWFINIVFSILIIFFQRRNPTTVWAWLLLLYFIPVLGFVLYLVLGQNFRKERMFKMKEIEGEIKYAVRRQEESIYRKRLRLGDPELERFKHLILYDLNEGEAVLTDNNDIRIYTDGEEKFRALLAEIKQAENYIHMQYYIIRGDELWDEIEEALIRKAGQGVEVRILFDSIGCRGRRGMKKADWERLRAAGIQ